VPFCPDILAAKKRHTAGAALCPGPPRVPKRWWHPRRRREREVYERGKRKRGSEVYERVER